MPAGWYPDPDNPQAARRYWDGKGWTGNRAPLDAGQKTQTSNSSGLVTAGWLGALLFAPLGFICGLMLLSRGENKHGGWILGISTVWVIFVIAALSSGGGGSTYSY